MDGYFFRGATIQPTAEVIMSPELFLSGFGKLLGIVYGMSLDPQPGGIYFENEAWDRATP